MSAVLKFQTDFVMDTCITCGINFCVPHLWNGRRRAEHNNYFCPNGHQQHYTAETEAERLKKELARERERTLAAQNQTRMERQQREKAERKLKRVDKGTCPKCNRHFVNVARHMTTKHKGT